MGIAQYIKEIGRGKEGARSLDTEQARDLFAQVLDREVTDLEVGAFCVAMRIKGETPEELEGFLAAAHARALRLDPGAVAVLLPSYNGARRLPNLTPLLAACIAREGVPVLVHGPRRDPSRVCSAEVFEALGWTVAESAQAAETAWRSNPARPVFMPLEVLSPALAALLAVRPVIGLRNPGHTIVKLLDPTPGGVRVVNYTHPEYGGAHARFLERTEATALLMRGSEGEPYADPRRSPRQEAYLQGRHQVEMSRAAQEGPLAELPWLPGAIDAGTTAEAIHAWLAGRQPLPAPITDQARRLVHLARTRAQAPLQAL